MNILSRDTTFSLRLIPVRNTHVPNNSNNKLNILENCASVWEWDCSSVPLYIGKRQYRIRGKCLRLAARNWLHDSFLCSFKEFCKVFALIVWFFLFYRVKFFFVIQVIYSEKQVFEREEKKVPRKQAKFVLCFESIKSGAPSLHRANLDSLGDLNWILSSPTREKKGRTSGRRTWSLLPAMFLCVGLLGFRDGRGSNKQSNYCVLAIRRCSVRFNLLSFFRVFRWSLLIVHTRPHTDMMCVHWTGMFIRVTKLTIVPWTNELKVPFA